MKVKLQVEGHKEVRAQLAKASVRYPGALAAALYGEGVGMYHAARELVPIDSGYLRDSAYVTKPKAGAERIALELGFGAPHASLQHQNTKYRHTKGEAKYLEKAVKNLSGGFLQRLAAQTQKNVDAGVQTVTTLVPGRKGSRKNGRMSRASRTAGARRSR